MMMSCRKATHLMSQELDRELATTERFALRFHVLMCSGCTNFRGNMAFLRRACSRVVEDAKNDRLDSAEQQK